VVVVVVVVTCLLRLGFELLSRPGVSSPLHYPDAVLP
jgi:hypothetical protein